MPDAEHSEPEQRPPGALDAMNYRPDHGEDSYRGSGRLDGKKARQASVRQHEFLGQVQARAKLADLREATLTVRGTL